jgi:hypothetical protein
MGANFVTIITTKIVNEPPIRTEGAVPNMRAAVPDSNAQSHWMTRQTSY